MAKKTKMQTQSSAPLLAGAAGGVLSQGAGLGAIGCKPEDNSFYCKSSRFVMNVKNILFIIMILALGFFLFKNRKQFMGKK